MVNVPLVGQPVVNRSVTMMWLVTSPKASAKTPMEASEIVLLPRNSRAPYWRTPTAHASVVVKWRKVEEWATAFACCTYSP